MHHGIYKIQKQKLCFFFPELDTENPGNMRKPKDSVILTLGFN